ncbi:MAG: hypothetical protein ACK52L_11480 [Pirellula sp.]
MASKPHKPEQILTATSNDKVIAKTRSGSGALRWLLVVIALCFFGYYYAIGRIDHKLTGEILLRLRKALPGHEVSLDRASLQPGKSILLEGVRIAKHTDQGSRNVLRCSRLICLGPIDWLGLAQGQVPIKQVIVDGVEIGVWPLSDGSWSIQKLRSGKPITPDFPSIEVRSGLIRIGSETGRSNQEVVCHDLQAKIGLLPRVPSNPKIPMAVQADFSVSSSHFTKLSVVARMNDTQTAWDANGHLEKFDYSPRLVSQLPHVVQQWLFPLDGASAELSGSFHAENHNQKVSWEGYARVTRGRWQTPKIAFPLEDLSADLYCKDSLLQVRNGKARSGDASLRVAVDWQGMTQQSPLTCIAEVDNLELNQRLFQSLPADIQETWKKLRATGRVDAQANIHYNGVSWKPHVIVQAKDVSVHPDIFPYPTHGISGRFEYLDGVITTTDLTGIAGEQRIVGSLTLTRHQPRWLLDLSLSADGPVALDETLLKALTPRGAESGGLQNFIYSLHPAGTVHLKNARFQRTADNMDFVSRSVEVTFSECSIKYDQFRYPIMDISGEAVLDNQRLILKDFAGRNDGARIKSSGTCQTRDGGIEFLDLQFDAYDVALDEELQSAMPLTVRGLWDQLQPTGSMDHAHVLIRKNALNEILDLRVEMIENRDPTASIGRSVAFRPAALPYSINDVECRIVYQPGRIDIRSLSGVHESSNLRAEGHCRLLQDGKWDGTIQWLPSSRFWVDQSFLNCMPEYVCSPLLRIGFRGPVSITGSTYIGSPNSQNGSIVRSWDLDLDIENGRIAGGAIASGMRGTISMRGENTHQGPIASGVVEFDSLAIKGVPVTGLTGPFAITQSMLYFGRDAIEWLATADPREGGVPSRGLNLDENVASAEFQHFAGDTGVVTQASLRQNLHNRLDARFATASRVLARETPEESPPPISQPPSNRNLPPLDVSEKDLKARALGGTLFLSGMEPLDGKRARYKVRLIDSHVRDCLLDLGETNPQANGRLWMQCDLNGSLTNLTAIEGSGMAWLREANLYQLPVMVRLLNLLSIRPDQGAFDAGDVKFSVDGERIPIEEMQLDGDLLSLRGNGWVNMRRELQLDLQANVSKRTIVGAMMHPLRNSPNLFMIEVTGTTSNPQMKRSVPLMNTFEGMR